MPDWVNWMGWAVGVAGLFYGIWERYHPLKASLLSVVEVTPIGIPHDQSVTVTYEDDALTQPTLTTITLQNVGGVDVDESQANAIQYIVDPSSDGYMV